MMRLIRQFALVASALASICLGVPASAQLVGVRGVATLGAAPRVTINVTGAVAATGWGLYTDAVRTANRLYGAASSDKATGTIWCALISGTDAYIKLLHTSSNTTGLVQVSINGGAWTTPTRDGTLAEFPLFTGQPQAAYFVAVRYGAAYGNNGYMDTSSANVLRVVGASPSVTPIATWAAVGDANANTLTATALASYPTANYLPAKIAATATSGISANIPTLAVRHNATEMTVVTADRYVYVSVDGAAPTRYDQNGQTTGTTTRATRISGLSGTHTYSVWSAGPIGSYFLGVGLQGGSISDISDKRRLDQYGDSITAGVAATSPGDTDEMIVAPALGMLAGNFGVAGNTTVQLEARMDAILAAKTVTSRDVAIIAIGRNDVGLWTSTQTTAYQSIVNKLIAKGYGKIICRGILATPTNYTTENAFIAGVVTATADARVVYLDTSGWSGIATADGVHPTDAGYVTLRNYAVTAYAPLIPA